MESVKNILVLAPHPDDAEFGCGGSLHKWVKEGKKVHVATFSPCLKSLPSGSEKDALYKEMSEAMKHLGIEEKNLRHFNFPVREFPKFRQDILEDLIKLRSEVSPELVLIPASFDFHQDHKTIHEEGLRAFKNSKLLGYELPWNNIECKINFHVKLSEQNVLAKEAAAASYASQKHRPYTKEGFFKSLAHIRGVQALSEYAEGFELIKWNS